MNAPIVVDAIDVSAEAEVRRFEAKPIGKAQLAGYAEMANVIDNIAPWNIDRLNDLAGLIALADDLQTGVTNRAKEAGVTAMFGTASGLEAAHKLAIWIMRLELSKRDAVLMHVRGKRR